jgi:hypothetical protein
MLDSSVLVAGGVLLLLCVVLAIALLRLRGRTRRELAAARAETESLRRQIAEIERVLAATPRPERPAPRVQETYTITGVGGPAATASTEPTTGPAPRIDQALFADLVLRETVVRAASLAHGVRRALAPEVRNRVRFEVKREIRRARKQRRADLKEARRDWEARQRASLDDLDHDRSADADATAKANDNDENAA